MANVSHIDHPSKWLKRKKAFLIRRQKKKLQILEAVQQKKAVQTTLLFEGDPSINNPQWIEVLNKIKSSQIVESHIVTFSISAGDSYLLPLDLPLKNTAKAKRILPGLLDLQLPFSVEDSSYYFTELGYHQGDSVTCALGAREVEILDALEALELQGIEVDAMDHEVFACWQYLTKNEKTEAAHILVLVEEDSVQLIAGKKQLPILSSQIVFDSANSEHSFRALRRTLKSSVEKLNSDDTELVVYIDEKHPYKTQIQQCLDPFSVKQSLRSGVLHFISSALAHRALFPQEESFSLLPEAKRPAVIDKKIFNASFIAAITLGCLGVLLCVASFGWKHIISEEDQDLQHKLNAKAQAMSGYTKVYKGQEVRMVQQSLAEAVKKQSSFTQVFEPSILEPLSHLLQYSKQHEGKIKKIKLSYKELEIKSLSKNMQGAEGLKELAIDLGYNASIKNLEATDEGLTVFEIKGVVSNHSAENAHE